MNSPSTKEVDDFLRRFRRGLTTLPSDIREDLVSEVRSHIEERLSQGKLDLASAFGSPEEYASRFVNEEALRSAVAGGRPWQLIGVLLGRVRATAQVVFVILPLGVIEIMGLVLAAAGVCKPFSPGHIGLFLRANGAFGLLGYISDPGSMHEVLGYAAMPIFIFGGLLLFWASHRLLLGVARGELGRIRLKR
ncbi:MAG: hypothetical protein WAM91_12475 [Candidatus Acidiferrales bacterium]